MAKIHGHTTKHSQSPTYTTYQNMLARCYRPSSPNFKNYGAAGISVCERWRESFANFLSDMGERPNGATIDRIDSSGNYSPENCRWATIEEQQSNISSNVFLTFNGETMHINAWARKLGIDASRIAWRLRHGWSTEQSLTIEPHTGNRTNKTRQRLFEFNGETLCVSDWARRYGLSISLLHTRIKKGMSIGEALTKPKGVFVTKRDHLKSP